MLVLLDDSFKAKAMIASRSDAIKEFVEPPYLRARQFFCFGSCHGDVWFYEQ